MTDMFLRNPHLNGDSFFLQGNNDIGLLLIHGFTATTVEVSYVAKYLNERGYTISAPLLPGHNTTPDDLNQCQWQDWVNAAEAAYQALATRCKKIIVGGESMGGMLALYLASEHPEIIAVITYAPAMITSSSSSRWQIQILSWFKSYLSKPQRPPNITDERTKSYTVNPLKAVIQFFDLQRETRQRLSRISQPILNIQGRLDVVIDPRNGEVILSEVRSQIKEMHWLEHSTHVVVLDQEWERAAELTLNFIQKIERHYG
ncbi:MAG: alpha/beta fold hydrolase [Chloroflexi bacterium]|nr:alpha/beta fold hydrolase [Chloroflexota bacterium]